VAGQRTVQVSPERIRHIAARHPEWLPLCLAHMADVLAAPEYLGYRPERDIRRVEFVRRVGSERRLLLVDRAPLEDTLKTRYLARRMRAGTMREVGRGP
jgi:hypothetical protein